MLINIVIIVLIFAAFSLFGMKVMADIDNFIADGGIRKKETKCCAQALVFGGGKNAKALRSALERMHIDVVQIEEITFLKEWEHISYVLAVSESDLDNLSVCNLSRSFYEPDYMASLCNEPEHLSLFRKAGIPVKESPERWLAELKATDGERSA